MYSKNTQKQESENDKKYKQRDDLYEENVKCNYWYGKCPVFTQYMRKNK